MALTSARPLPAGLPLKEKQISEKMPLILPGPAAPVDSAESSDEADFPAGLRKKSAMKSSEAIAVFFPFPEIGSSSIARSTSGSKILRERRQGLTLAITHDIAKGNFWKVFL
jgi:hypothetical protein